MENSKKSSPTSIQNELNRIFKAPLNPEGSKACLFNLIVYTHESHRTAYFTQIVKLIKTQFPCRIIFITNNPLSKENYFHVKSSCEKNQDGTGFACDEFFIETAGQDLNRVNFILLPLFVPDLPIYLLWGQDPTTEYTILPHLENFATRLIFDAETTEDLQQFSREMLNRINSSPIQIVDMNWARMGGWREILAQSYDSKDGLEQLAAANHIELIYSNQPSELFTHPNTQAIYLQAWLASCLEWNFVKAEKKDHSLIIHYLKSNRKSCEIKLSSSLNSNLETGEIIEIGVSGDKDYHCQMKRLSPEQVKVQVSNQFECGLPFLLLMPTLLSGRSFMQEIFFQKTSDQYEKMLRIVSMIRWS